MGDSFSILSNLWSIFNHIFHFISVERISDKTCHGIALVPH